MRPQSPLLVLAAATFVGILLPAPNASTAQEVKPIAGAQNFAITARDISTLRARALSGSGEAALRLSRHYGIAMHDSKAAVYWLQIAAENGSSLAQLDYAYKLAGDRNAEDQNRAMYWAREALKSDASADAARAFLREHAIK
jgi:TPR repeat protein